MTKRLPTPDPEETVTIPKSSFDNIFATMQDMLAEIQELHKEVDELRGVAKQDKLLSVQEAANYCGRSRQTIAAWRRENKIKKVVRGGRTGYLKSELDKVKEI